MRPFGLGTRRRWTRISKQPIQRRVDSAVQHKLWDWLRGSDCMAKSMCTSEYRAHSEHPRALPPSKNLIFDQMVYISWLGVYLLGCHKHPCQPYWPRRWLRKSRPAHNHFQERQGSKWLYSGDREIFSEGQRVCRRSPEASTPRNP